MLQKTCFSLFFLILSFTLTRIADTAPVQVGEKVVQTFESPHPYNTHGHSYLEVKWIDVIQFPAATYIAPHFEAFELGPDDYLVISSPHRKQSYTMTAHDNMKTREGKAGFWGTHIKGDTVILELFGKKSSVPHYGYRIDYIARGFTHQEIQSQQDRNSRALCGQDDTANVRCYYSIEPDIYDKSRAVARLLINGNYACTGWLIGREGHLITNNHCIEDQDDADNTDFEFMAEGPDCTSDCQSGGSCPGTIVANEAQLIKTDYARDYSLVLLPTNASDDYGYLQLRESGAVIDERIYIPQHPQFWGKMIAVDSTATEDQSGYCEIWSLSEPPCHAGIPADIGYFADTQGGSSGSPVIAYSDHKVVGLHHCADCPNRAVPIQDIITHLGDKMPDCAMGVLPDAPDNISVTSTGDNLVSLSWNSTDPEAATFNVYRGYGSCPPADYLVIARNISGLYYDDITASGGVTYTYVVSATDRSGYCESDFSNCVGASTTGACLDAPLFAGVKTIDNLELEQCRTLLSWDPATLICDGPVFYSVYRSLSPDFTPDETNKIATGITTEWYYDTNALIAGADYYYIVRATDMFTEAEDSNTNELKKTVTGPVVPSVLFEETFDACSGFCNMQIKYAQGSTGWEGVQFCKSRNIFRFGGTLCDETYPNDVFALTTPSGTAGDATAGITIPTNASSLSLQIQHAWHFENNNDGAWLYISDNNNNFYYVYTSYITAGGYNGFRGSMPVWNGTQESFTTTVVDMNSLCDDYWGIPACAGKTLWVGFTTASNSSIVDSGWFLGSITINADLIQTCDTQSLAPVPDNLFIPGAFMEAEKIDASGSSISLSWEPNSCNQNYNILWGSSSDLNTYSVSQSGSSECNIGLSGTFFWSAPAIPDNESFIWWIIVGTDKIMSESLWGYDSNGDIRSGIASGQCNSEAISTGTACE